MTTPRVVLLAGCTILTGACLWWAASAPALHVARGLVQPDLRAQPESQALRMASLLASDIPSAMASAGPSSRPAPRALGSAVGDDAELTTRVLAHERAPHLRNEDMDVLRNTRHPQALAIFHRIATDTRESERMRSWGIQHLGMSWALMDRAERDATYSSLVSVWSSPSAGELPQREALLALSCSPDSHARSFVEREVDQGFAAVTNPRIDLVIRLAGELGLTRHRQRIRGLTKVPSVAVAGAAREASARLER